MAGQAMLRTLDTNDEMSSARTINLYHVMVCVFDRSAGTKQGAGIRSGEDNGLLRNV